MRTLLAPLLTLCALLLAGPAAAQYELAWDKCPGSPGALANKRFACNEGQPAASLVLAITPPRSLPYFVGYLATLEISSAQRSLPDWWRLGLGECRDGVINASISPGTVAGTCENPWRGANTGGGSLWETDWFGPGRSRFQVVFARSTATALSPGTRYFAAHITLDAAGTGSCSGCASEVCIAVVQVDFSQIPPTGVTMSESETEVQVTRSTGQNVVSFNSTSTSPCGATVRNRTWGQVKTTYR